MHFKGHNTSLLNLDAHLDIASLIREKDKIDMAIATSINKKYFSYLPGNDHYIDLVPNYKDWTKVYEKMVLQYPELEKMSHNERATFVLLNQDTISFSEFIEIYKQKPCIEHKFDFLFSWLEKQNVFEKLDSSFVFINSEGKASLKHIDASERAQTRQLLWISLDKRKRFFMEIDGVKTYATDHCIAFLPSNPHGTDADLRMNYSIRFEGKFSQAFKEKAKLTEHFK